MRGDHFERTLPSRVNTDGAAQPQNSVAPPHSMHFCKALRRLVGCAAFVTHPRYTLRSTATLTSMIKFPLVALTVLATSFLSATTASAQDGASQPATVHPQVQAALVSLQQELNALRNMLHSIGNSRKNSEDRISAMNAYMKEKNLMDGWYAYSSSTTAVPAGTSFMQGYQGALQNEKMAGVPVPSTTDIDAMTRQVAATTTLAQESWNAQNKNFQTVALISAYLQSKDALVGYQQWAPAYAAKQRDAQKERYAAANKAADEKQQAYLQHLDALHQIWDQQPHDTGMNFNYGFSQGYGANEGGTGEGTSAGPGGGVGVNAPNVVGANTPWSYAGAKGGFYPGAYSGGAYYGNTPPGNDYNVNFGNNGYYAGSNYNSYSDTYPDLYGYPAGTDLSVNGFGRNGINNIWNRSGARGLPPTPNGVMPGVGGDRGAGGERGGAR